MATTEVAWVMIQMLAGNLGTYVISYDTDIEDFVVSGFSSSSEERAKRLPYVVRVSSVTPKLHEALARLRVRTGEPGIVNMQLAKLLVRRATALHIANEL